MEKSMKKFTFFFFLIISYSAFSQDDLLSLLGEEKSVDIATAAFKTNRVINGHSIENTAKGVMDFKINHRFGAFNNKDVAYSLLGLDNADIRFGFDYGITDKLMIGVGRNSYEKVYDGFLKYRIIRQQTGLKNIPLSISYMANMDFKTLRWTGSDTVFNDKTWLRAYFTHQILIARKFSEGTTIQLMPTLVHRNLARTVKYENGTSFREKNDIFLMGIAARQKLSKRVAVNVEYTYAFPNQLSKNHRNTLSLGFDIETGGHVFQLFFTNSSGTDHRSFLTETQKSWRWKDESIRFGFNVSRVFTIVKPKELKM